MILAELLSKPAMPRALVVGAFGGTGLVLTVVYSRRGPMTYSVYAAVLAALALLSARYPAVRYPGRFGAALAGFAAASAPLYVAVGVLAARERRRRQSEGRLPASAARVPLVGHAWRAAFLLAVGALDSGVRPPNDHAISAAPPPAA